MGSIPQGEGSCRQVGGLDTAVQTSAAPHLMSRYTAAYRSTDLAALFDTEVKEISRLLSPGSRRHIEANARLRALAIVEGAFRGEKLQPGQADLNRVAEQIRQGKSWQELFPGVASLDLSAKGYGPSIDLRIT